MPSFMEHIEIIQKYPNGRFEVWRVLIDPKEKLYPVYWKWHEDNFKYKRMAELWVKRKFPDHKIEYEAR